MDCNKDEAIKAKGIAEKKMESRDFLGAKKIALKAQQLYSELDGISQMMTVIDVHCSAEKKVMDNENDWYAILKLEVTADEASIKKQYRKLALLLHPDKNKLAGAEAAFKLIGEAHRVLSDRDTRWKYDNRYKAHKNRPAYPQQRSNTTQRQPAASNGFGSINRAQFTTVNLQREQPHIQPGMDKPTFWTVCPFCTMKYQYYRDILNRALRCQNCMKPFIAYDLNVQGVPTGIPTGVPTGANVTRPPAPTQPKGVSHPLNTNAGTSNVNRAPTKKAEKDEGVKVAEKKENLKRPKFEAETVNAGKKKRRAESETSESADSESSSEEFDIQGGVPAEQNSGHPEGRNARRSSRQKRQVVYNEDSDDDFVSPHKDKRSSKDKNEASLGKETSKASKPTEVSEEPKKTAPFEESQCNGNVQAEACKTNGDAQIDDVEDLEESPGPGKTLPDPEFIEVADPEFYVFDNDRKEDCFENDQMWAVYDNTDGMPRFYARIKKVFSNGFKVKITWLEPNPDDKEEIDWVVEDLPVSCGKFKHGKTENTEDINMFSHLVHSCKEIKRGSLAIYPAKGETWAIFKNWKMDWNSDPDNHRSYEFEFVEIMSDYGEGSGGIIVAYLEKVKGFVGLFSPKKDVALYEIPPNELYRFSHMVPCYRMKGNERDGLPEGAIELDPASLPDNLVGPNNS